MSTTFRRPGDCGTAMIRIKKWDKGFSIKCLQFGKTRTIEVMPFDEAYYQQKCGSFCEGCPEISNSKKKGE